MAQADRCCNVMTSPIPGHHGIRLAAPLYVAVPDVEQSDVPVFSRVFAGCQCRSCASNCKWRCAHGLLCHSPALHSLVSCSHYDRTFMRGFVFDQQAHFQTFDSLSALTFVVAQHASLSHRPHQPVQLLVVPASFKFSRRYNDTFCKTR